LEVAILNLVINARDATEGGGEITISADNVTFAPDKPLEGLVGEFVRITVADTGAGMDEETLRRAVEPFFTTKPLGRGTGLGLSQVYGFTRQSGGGVRLESSLGFGASVCIFLPRSRETPAAPAPCPRRDADHAGGRILVVEDEDRVAELVCELLRDLNYECERAFNADQALRMDLSRYHVLFTDVFMPGKLDGLALAQEVRRRHPALPILLTTGFAGAPERIAGAGFPVLAKPYNFDQLSDALKALLGVSRC
jgi:CheY-like chemotaxis protein